jgi:hypothetical protein
MPARSGITIQIWSSNCRSQDFFWCLLGKHDHTGENSLDRQLALAFLSSFRQLKPSALWWLKPRHHRSSPLQAEVVTSTSCGESGTPGSRCIKSSFLWRKQVPCEIRELLASFLQITTELQTAIFHVSRDLNGVVHDCSSDSQKQCFWAYL